MLRLSCVTISIPFLKLTFVSYRAGKITQDNKLLFTTPAFQIFNIPQFHSSVLAK